MGGATGTASVDAEPPKRLPAANPGIRLFGGAFSGRCNSLAALEAAARRELAAARKQKKSFSFFGGK